MNGIVVHIVSPASIKDGAAYLTDQERRHAARFHFEKDANHWIACRAALRRVLAEQCQQAPDRISIFLTETGKPFLAAPHSHVHFNLSHCHDLALIAISDKPVGIDIEPVTRAPDLLECVRTFCHPEEIASLPVDSGARAEQLLLIWTAKEALLKSLGTGLLQPPEEVLISFGKDRATATCDSPLLDCSSQLIRRLSHPSLADHIAFISSSPDLEEIAFR